MSMHLLAFVVLACMGQLYAADIVLSDYEAKGACISSSIGSGLCPTNFTCFMGQCYLSTLPCLSFDGPVTCPPGMVCIGASTGNACVVLQSSQAPTVPSVPTGAPSSCVDLAPTGQVSDCPQKAYLCNNPIYYAFMTQQCPRTCNRCPGSNVSPQNPGTTCLDLVGANGISNCAQMAYLCNNALYLNLMTQQCPRTCGRC